MLVDTHAHLDFSDDVDGWIERAKEAGVNKIICVGTSVEASKRCVAVAQKYSSDDLKIYTTVGIHAQDGKDDVRKFGLHYIDILKSVAQSSRKVVAIGECGFDFKVTSDELQVINEEGKEFQKKLFVAQIELAVDLNLPLVIHCRNAWDETIELISNFKFQISNFQLRGVFHSWTGDWEAAKRVLELGFYISFSGIVTFKNALNVQEVARKMPLDAMLLETDSPFLAPDPLRGSPNEPKNVKITAEFIAALRNVSPNKIADITSRNAKELFGI